MYNNDSMNLAMFDLDNTLLDGDSDYLWGRFMVDEGVVDRGFYEQENQRFYEQYKKGNLDIHAYCRFAFKPLAETPLNELHRLRKKFIDLCIRPLILSKAKDLLKQHRLQGDHLLIITSTNRFVTEPIANELGVNTLIATEPEFTNDGYTGELHGTPCFREGKVTRLHSWLVETEYTLANSWFYSDSHNDIPLLEIVSHPIAVDADLPLSKHARKKGWPIISLKG